MKKLLTILLALHLCAFSAYADDDIFAEEVLSAQGSQIGAKAAIVMEAFTGRVVFEQNPHARLPIASTTKILTALITLEQPNLDAVFTVNENAITVEGSSMGLQKGDKVTLRALAAGMLLPSGNDAANAAAHRIAGSIPAFVDMMNERVKEMGLENTCFETPSGLDGENHYSSAYDLALIAREALKNDEFAAICSQYKIRTSFGNPPYDRWLTNHNKLLNYYDGAIGIKTGFTKKAGRCLVSAARRNGVDLICVTLDCPNDWTVHKALLDRNFERIEVDDLAKGVPQVFIPVAGGASPQVQANLTDQALVPIPVDGAKIEYKIIAEPFVYAPVLKGRYLGEAQIYVDGDLVYRITLDCGEDVPLLHEYKEDNFLFNILKGFFKTMQ